MCAARIYVLYILCSIAFTFRYVFAFKARRESSCERRNGLMGNTYFLFSEERKKRTDGELPGKRCRKLLGYVTCLLGQGHKRCYE